MNFNIFVPQLRPPILKLYSVYSPIISKRRQINMVVISRWMVAYVETDPGWCNDMPLSLQLFVKVLHSLKHKKMLVWNIYVLRRSPVSEPVICCAFVSNRACSPGHLCLIRRPEVRLTQDNEADDSADKNAQVTLFFSFHNLLIMLLTFVHDYLSRAASRTGTQIT